MTRTGLFRYPEDRVPVAIFLAYFALDLGVYFAVDSVWLLAAWWLAGLFPKACIAAWNHHHQHLLTFRSPVLNRALELVYGLQTGMTSNAWVLHHTFGHHLHYLDQTLDESRWKRRDGSTMGPIAYSLEVMFTSYLRAFRVGLERRAQLPVFIGMLLVTMLVIGVALWFRPLSGLFVFVLAPAASLFITAYATYKHHSGLDTTDPYAASRNIVDPIFNLFTGNLGFHTAHHLKPGVHWSRLPALHRELAPRIPEACYLPAEFPFNLWPQRESQRTR